MVYTLPYPFGTGTPIDYTWPPQVGADFDYIIDALNGLSPVTGNTLVYQNKAEVEAATIDAAVEGFLLLGYNSAGDRGSATYARSDTEPTHEGKIQSADGAWWELRSTTATPFMFGASGQFDDDDTIPVQNCINFCTDTGTIFMSSGAGFLLTSTIVVDGRITMIGAGRDSTGFITGDAVDDVCFVFTEEANGSFIQGFSFGGAQIIGTGNPAVIILPGCNNLVFQQNFIQGGSTCLLQQGTDNLIHDNEMRFAYGASIVINYGDVDHSSGIWYSRNKLDHATGTAPANGYVVNARANSTHYNVNDIITNQGWYIQCVVAGTTGVGNPTFAQYENNFTDGSAQFQIYCPIGYASVLITSGSSEVFLDNNDHSGAFDICIGMIDSDSGGAPYLVHVSHSICGQQRHQAIYAGAGHDCYIGQGCELNPGWSDSDSDVVATDVDFEGNIHVCDCDILSGNSDAIALKFYGGYNGVTVADNYFKGSFNQGIVIDTGGGGIENITITGNNFDEANSISIDGGADWYVVTSNQTHGGGVSGATSASQIIDLNT